MDLTASVLSTTPQRPTAANEVNGQGPAASGQRLRPEAEAFFAYFKVNCGVS